VHYLRIILYIFLSILLSIVSSCKRSSEEFPATIDGSIAKALKWLSERQFRNGAFPEGALAWEKEGALERPHPAMSALVLYAMVSAPEKLRNPYKKNIEKCIKYLISEIDQEGCIGTKSTLDLFYGYPSYATSIALLAMLSYKPQELKPHIDKLVKYLRNSQLVEHNGWKEMDKDYYGAWGWDFKKGKIPFKVDLSCASYIIEGLIRAGIKHDDPVFQKFLIYLGRCQNIPESNNDKIHDGGFFFMPSRSKAGYKKLADGRILHLSYGSMTCDGLRSLIAIGFDRSDKRVSSAIDWLRENYTIEKNPGYRKDAENADVLFETGTLFYYYHSLAKVLSVLGEKTIEIKNGKKVIWAKEITDKLLSLQTGEGFWINKDGFMKEDDPFIATSFSILALSTAYHWLEK
jgi:squalene-hopene/tetraprenyl-beta-curcumene cyclase